MTAFEKSLRALDEDALRAGAEELLTLLAEADGIRPERGDSRGDGGQKQRSAAARVSALVTANVPSGKDGGEAESASTISAPALGGVIPKTARAHRTYPKTEDSTPAVEETPREDDKPLPEPVPPKTTAGENRGEREKRKVQDDREDLPDRENRENTESRSDREDRRVREDQKDREAPENSIKTLRTQDWETVDRAEAQALEKQLQSVSQQRRGKARQSGEDGVRTAAFRGPERQYDGAVGARGTEMRRISDYFRRDSRRYDTGFTTY